MNIISCSDLILFAAEMAAEIIGVGGDILGVVHVATLRGKDHFLVLRSVPGALILVPTPPVRGLQRGIGRLHQKRTTVAPWRVPGALPLEVLN